MSSDSSSGHLPFSGDIWKNDPKLAATITAVCAASMALSGYVITGSMDFRNVLSKWALVGAVDYQLSEWPRTAGPGGIPAGMYQTKRLVTLGALNGAYAYYATRDPVNAAIAAAITMTLFYIPDSVMKPSWWGL